MTGPARHKKVASNSKPLQLPVGLSLVKLAQFR